MQLSAEVDLLLERRESYEVAKDFYEGTADDLWRTSKLRQLVRKSTNISLNFCRTIVDAPLARLEVANVLGTSDEANTAIAQIWEQPDLVQQMNQVHKTALIYGEAYAIVWPVDGVWRINCNTPDTVAAVYNDEDPTKMDYAFKLWAVPGPTGVPAGHRLTVYTDSVILKYSTKAAEITATTDWGDPVESVANPFGRIPVFHFRTDLEDPRPEHFDAYDAQRAINEHLSEQLITSMYQSFPQRWAVAADDNISDEEDFDQDETQRELRNAVKNEPGSLWKLVGYKDVGQFDPAKPEVFWTPIRNLLLGAASITSTPLHYFDRTAVVSGQALRVAEAPLMKKVRDRQLMFGIQWRAIFEFILSSMGVSDKLYVKWMNNESVDIAEQWEIASKKVLAGLSRRAVLREMGYTDKEIDDIQREVQAEMEIYPKDSKLPDGREVYQSGDNSALRDMRGLGE